MSDNPNRKLGALPRTYDPSMPHLSAVRMMVGNTKLPSIPDSLNLMDGMPDDFGMMVNDKLGCCTAAAAYHAMQVWSHIGRGRILTEPDNYVEQMYREFTGYNGTPETDQGGIEQDILRKWLQIGVPVQEGVSEAHPEPGRSFIRAAMEVSPFNIDNIKRAIYECGAVYIGFDVPSWLMDTDPLPSVWNNNIGRQLKSVGGHAVSCHGYDKVGVDLISWGKHYRMTWAMWNEVVSEVYALVHPWYINATGLTPFGINQQVLVSQMTAFCGKSVA